jgi:Calcineurin-like phosphoesterase
LRYNLIKPVSTLTWVSIRKLRLSRKMWVSSWLIFLLIMLLIGSLVSFQFGGVEGRDSLFSFVQIGDTQGANETQLQSIVDFILGNMSALNIEYVVHMGDIVEISDDRSDWELKNATFSQLTGVVSFGWLSGNHDGEPESYIGDEYFAFDVSSYPDMTSSYDHGRNTAQYFSFGSDEFLFVNVDYFANESSLVWFSDLYQQYPQATVIFSTHSYLDLTGNYTGDTLDSSYLDAFPRVKLVLCGHLPYALNQLVNGREEIALIINLFLALSRILAILLEFTLYLMTEPLTPGLIVSFETSI